jgi:hypothetical protein
MSRNPSLTTERIFMAKKTTISLNRAEAMRAAAIESTPDLCKTLGFIAALHVDDKKAQKKIYDAIRHLQILANLPPMPPKK